VTFIDVETTTLDSTKSAILQIAIITDWENGNQDTWTTRIKPRDIELKFADKQALKICNYNKDDWKDAPAFEEVADKIIEKLAWGPIIGHNIQFDIDHLTAAFKRRGWSELGRKESLGDSEKKYKIGYPLVDTCALAFLFLSTERQNLNALREYFNIDIARAHDALNDVEDCREVFYNILHMKLADSE
jgi:DNA polymerase III epsilon subunit-like protein